MLTTQSRHNADALCLLWEKDSLDEIVQRYDHYRRENPSKQDVLFLAAESFVFVIHIQVIRDCLVARRMVLICGGEQRQAFALCNEDLSFFACRLLVPVKRCSAESLRVSCAA